MFVPALFSSLAIRRALLAALLAGTAAAPANAEIRIGASLPLSGDFELLGRQALDAMKVAAANFSGDTVTIVEADDACETQGGQDAAVALQEAAVEIVIGYICTEAADGGLPALKEDALTALVIGARTASLTETAEKNGWKLLRIAPAARHEREAVGAILSRQWRDVPFAIIDDGTLYGRELAEGLRFAAEENGLKPVFVDTFRPQLDNQVALVRRLQKAGATHVFIGGDAADAAVIGADAARLGVPLTLAGGDTFRASPLDVELPEGTLMVSTPDWATTLQANDAAFALQRAGVSADGYALPAHAAVELAAHALHAAHSGGQTLQDALRQGDVATALGVLRFDAIGDLVDNPFRLFIYDRGAFRPVDDTAVSN